MDYNTGLTSPNHFATKWPRERIYDRPNYLVIEMNATHGAIGGTPGYSNLDAMPTTIDYDQDRKASIEADTTIRREARQVGVPVKLKDESEYGFPATSPNADKRKEK